MSQPKLSRIGGLPAVSALFERNPQRAERLFFDDRMKAEAQPLCKQMAAARKPFRHVSTEELAKVAGTPLNGGIVVVCQPQPLAPLEAVKSFNWAKAREPLVILDGIGNPHNLGAIARTMAFFGLTKLILSDHPEQALPSDAAYRVAEGGLEWIDVYQAPALAKVLPRLKPHYHVVGTALGAHRPMQEIFASHDKPLALVLGNEEDGLPAPTLAACDDIVTIPGSGRVQSLNVSATASILIHLLAGSVR
ncbi:TrmH family RNA methyltransferase [Magnetospirillum sulfuroxidans]|uniref:RNA methyltransferase n=1 Tax=Magnetospirillum sulfuroxidans TaxID=611300 RepID=A0ABS5I7K8_9PROT|nr:RNA methyltransferase [Magnetospirillum sulfuroxidans]MBR9970421.1 RNA methyltransferase [Magnetospirillum sulfuroxidans]